MIINFNVERLDRLLQDFYRLTGLTVSIWDAELNMLSSQPKEMSNFCRKIRESPEGSHRCFLSDKKVCMESLKTGKPSSHFCHAGLIDTAVPIKYKDSIMGYMMFGQIAYRTDKTAQCTLKSVSRDLNIDYNNLLELYNELDIYDEEKIAATANVLKMATRYLWLSEYIEIRNNDLATRIDDYIKANIAEDISIKTLCNDLDISKNKLYEISHDCFGMSIGSYISSIRIKEAKRLLNTTDFPVSQIGDMVGIKDYNYFTKFFKSRVGTPPLKYRKRFPYDLHKE